MAMAIKNRQHNVLSGFFPANYCRGEILKTRQNKKIRENIIHNALRTNNYFILPRYLLQQSRNLLPYRRCAYKLSLNDLPFWTRCRRRVFIVDLFTSAGAQSPNFSPPLADPPATAPIYDLPYFNPPPPTLRFYSNMVHYNIYAHISCARKPQVCIYNEVVVRLVRRFFSSIVYPLFITTSEFKVHNTCTSKSAL